MPKRAKTPVEDPAEVSRRVKRRKSRKRRRERLLTPNRAVSSSSTAPVERQDMQLRDYQDEAVSRAMEFLGRPEGGGFCLFKEQRTGKTPTTCYLIQLLKPATILIACPKIAVKTWEDHLLQYGLYEGREVRIINFESNWSLRKQLRRWQPEMVIVDEAHRIKNRMSHQSRALRWLGHRAMWKLALTGTPLDGKLENAWATYDFIDPTVFGTWQEFADRYLIYGGFKGMKIVGYKNVEEFEEKFASRFFRVLLEDVKEVPTQIDPPNLVQFDLVASRPAYDSMEQKFLVGLNQYVRVKRGDSFVRIKQRVVAPRVITQIMKLHQLSGGFILDEEKKVHRFGDEKLEQTGALLMELGNVPTVIVVKFIPEMRRLAALIRAMGRTVSMIGDKQPFTGFTTDVIIVQIRSGLSIDLSRAEEMIFHSWGHSFIDYDQAQFRIRSFTSVRARYHFLIAKNTIDEDLYETISSKRSVVTVVLDKYRRRRSA